MVTALACAYVRYGDTPAVDGLLYGIVPAVIAIIVHALLGLLRTAIKTVWLAGLVSASLIAYLVGVNELVVLAAGALLAAAGQLLRARPCAIACTASSSRRCSQPPDSRCSPTLRAPSLPSCS